MTEEELTEKRHAIITAKMAAQDCGRSLDRIVWSESEHRFEYHMKEALKEFKTLADELGFDLVEKTDEPAEIKPAELEVNNG